MTESNKYHFEYDLNGMKITDEREISKERKLYQLDKIKTQNKFYVKMNPNLFIKSEIRFTDKLLCVLIVVNIVTEFLRGYLHKEPIRISIILFIFLLIGFIMVKIVRYRDILKQIAEYNQLPE